MIYLVMVLQTEHKRGTCMLSLCFTIEQHPSPCQCV